MPGKPNSAPRSRSRIRSKRAARSNRRTATSFRCSSASCSTGSMRRPANARSSQRHTAGACRCTPRKNKQRRARVEHVPPEGRGHCHSRHSQPGKAVGVRRGRTRGRNRSRAGSTTRSSSFPKVPTTTTPLKPLSCTGAEPHLIAVSSPQLPPGRRRQPSPPRTEELPAWAATHAGLLDQQRALRPHVPARNRCTRTNRRRSSSSPER